MKTEKNIKKCYCPECGEKLIPKMGQKNCQSNFETSLHLYAKEVIKNKNRITIPRLTIGDGNE